MSFDKPTRNLLAKTVTICRDLLASDISDQLQSSFGLYPDGSVVDVARTEADRAAAAELKALWEHFASAEPFESNTKGSASTSSEQAKPKTQEKRAKAYQRLVREIGFTMLNRLAALRLCEERGLLIECVRRGVESDGFRMYDRLANGALGGRYETYQSFLQSLFDELAMDLGVLFDRSAPQSLVFPTEPALNRVLTALNDPELNRRDIWKQDETIGWIYQFYNDPLERKKMRDDSPTPRNSRELAVRNQFFTPRYVVEFLTDNTLGRTWYEMRAGETCLVEGCQYLVRKPIEIYLRDDVSRFRNVHPGILTAMQGDFSKLPENPSEQDWQRLALLVDGDKIVEILGEENASKAIELLTDYPSSHALPARSHELWYLLFVLQRGHGHVTGGLSESEKRALPDVYSALRQALQDEARQVAEANTGPDAPVYIPPKDRRELKDPRDLKILDPACGSGHFLLYAFDLLLAIYEEAWEDSRLPPSKVTQSYLSQDYATLDDLRRAAPMLIIHFNLHGVEIDPRAAQIAALALWLRAQRAYQELRLKPANRPRIEKSNIVVAEPMPGDSDIRAEFLQTIELPFIRYLASNVFEKMELAGEAGFILRIEEEIREPIRQAKQQWLKGSKTDQLGLWPEAGRPKEEQLASFDLSGISDEAFWDQAEGKLLAILDEYARKARNGKVVRRRLFAHDAEEGFAFIELCRKKFNIILMNPPFGSSPEKLKAFLEKWYLSVKNDLASVFIEAGISYLSEEGQVGALTTRNILTLNGYQDWRVEKLIRYDSLRAIADLGYGVLDDAMVEVAAYAVTKKQYVPPTRAIFISCLQFENKNDALLNIIDKSQSSDISEDIRLIPPRLLERLPGAVITASITASIIEKISGWTNLESKGTLSKLGMSSGQDERFLRAVWEISPKNIGRDRQWIHLAKGGEWNPFWDDIHLLILWENKGQQVKNTEASIRNEDFFFQSGLTYPERTTSSFGPRILPTGCIFSTAGPGIFASDSERNLAYLGLLLSRPGQFLVELSLGSGDSSVPGTAARHYLNGMVNRLPFSDLTTEDFRQVATIVKDIVAHKRNVFTFDETSRNFSIPFANFSSSPIQTLIIENKKQALLRILNCAQLVDHLEQLSMECFQLNDDESQRLLVDFVSPLPTRYDPNRHAENLPEMISKSESQLISMERSSSGVGKRYITKNCQLIDRKVELLAHILNVPVQNVINDWIADSTLEPGDSLFFIQNLLSYLIGSIYGRWDIRCLLTNEIIAKYPDDPFTPLPICPPGMLIGPDGLPAKENDLASEAWLRARPDIITLPFMQEESPNQRVTWEGQTYSAAIPDTQYPFHIQWDGILVDDPGLDGKTLHPSDVVRRVREALVLLWPKTYEAVEAEACEILGVGDLRDYFRKPSGFFSDHLSRYSKSRRQAPIYWQLSTASGRYSLWIYYHRLSNDILYTAINRYVEPKIGAVERRVDDLQIKLSEPMAGGTVSASSPNRSFGTARDEMEDLKSFLTELRAFRDELLRIAGLPFQPNLDDGVILNAAPFYKLFRLSKWAKDTESTWKMLTQGEFNWAHIAYTIWPEQVMQACREDKSIAIAHGLESLYVEKESKKTKKKKDTPKQDDWLDGKE